MSTREQARLQVLVKVIGKELEIWDAAKLMGLSERQVWRILADYRQEGVVALVHGNRGRRPVNAIEA